MSLTHIVTSNARNGDHVSNISPQSSIAEISLEESSVSPLPLAKDQQEKDIPAHCTSCNLSSFAVANCISCTTLPFANCVIIHL